VAWEIYQRFKPARVLGIDIDPELIEAARTKLGHACRRDGVDHGKAVGFACRDVVAVEEGESVEMAAQPSYDVVTCLSVTKHVHLQGGDAALLRLFRRVHSLLRPGGRFVLEPQPWRTYRKRKHASAESARHYASIQLRPPFTDVLLDDVGFAAVENLGVPPGAAAGYQRPLYCFVKAEAVAAQNGEAAAPVVPS
jgi:7SK snRNA methylphosphate capping enzyme